ncbi:MAG: ABC transporter substrate-binding protein [Clostridiales bacterium]|nr:ABC transporter substrate-binding protein [Clostridiales bacterium]
MKKKWAMALIVILAVALLSACGSGGGGGGGTQGGGGGSAPAPSDVTLTIGHQQAITTLDSAFAYDFDTNPAVVQIMEPLLIVDEQGNLTPCLASSWKEVDPTTYTYEIVQNAKFSDGNPMTMDDVLYSLQRYQDPKLASYLAWMYGNVASIKQTGPWEITVKLTQPDAMWKYVPATTAGDIHEKAVVEKLGDKYGTVGGFPIGTGPYTVGSWVAGGDITLKYNPNYWNAQGKTPQVTTIVFQTISEDATRALATASGQLDINLSASVDLLDKIKAGGKADIMKMQRWGGTYIALNCGKAPFDDVNARRALASAIDIKTIQSSIIKDYGDLSNGIMIPESLYGADKDSWTSFAAGVPQYAYDQAKAKDYLKQSKYPNGFSFALTVDQNTVSNAAALAIQQQLAAVGITMTINKVSNDEATSQQFGSGIVDGKRPYDALIAGWIGDFPDAGGMLMPIITSDNTGEGGSNFAAYSNADVDKLMNDQNQMTDPAQRLSTLQQAVKIVADEQPYYILCQTNWLFGVNKRLTNINDVLTSDYTWYFPIQDLKVAAS